MVEAVARRMQEMVAAVGYPYATGLFETLSGGKRLRARLIMMIAGESDASVTLAAVIELIHAASLLHDDVIDEAQLRRGTPSVNATEGSKQAVMLGDILYSKAFSELTQFDAQIAKTVADAVTSLSVGEMMDVQMAKAFNEDDTRYLQMLYLKTGVLIEAAAKSAAMLVGKNAGAYALYGKNLGVAFQIIDDILDIVSDEATLGKPAMNDFVEGKCTLPYIHLYRTLEGEARERLIALHGKSATAEETRWLKEQLEASGAVKAAYAQARRLSDEAKQAVSGDAPLEAVIESMMQRTF
ncbi:polyprenyl synthetase family protein [Sulfurimonas sp. HSL1-2]|uniref:polyprenyl synthetase family protein n=1 Tax=Thiomicrolovo zhangzhouensis TaxID=3131933 RepID=UPI0031F93270